MKMINKWRQNEKLSKHAHQFYSVTPPKAWHTNPQANIFTNKQLILNLTLLSEKNLHADRGCEGILAPLKLFI